MKQPAAVYNMRSYKRRQSLNPHRKGKVAKKSNELQPHTLKFKMHGASTHGLVQAQRQPDTHPQIASSQHLTKFK